MASEEGSQKKEQKSLWSRYMVWLIVPVILALYFSQEKSVLAQNKQGRVVLPADVVPTHYDLNLTPDLDHFVYNGTVKVDLNVIKKTSSIVLNSNEIAIDIAKVTLEDVSYSATDIQYNNKTHQVSLQFDKSFPKDSKINLEIIFRGVLNNQMSGFYRSSFKNEKGVTKYLASTQFEATDARRAFPCWDEPSLKATFDITLNVPSDLVALSNMEIISETPTEWSSNLKTVKYATTPRMSTYLVAMVVGPFEYIEKFTTGEHNGRPIRTRVYTLPGLSHQGKHALNVATQALEYYAQVFGVPYPLSKLDMVAIPDFDAGAMENWGLVTYRTTALLYDEEKSAFVYKRQTAYTVTHELAHQWFGNLVTMEWWDHLWLNEGFATWVGWFAIDHIYPDWRTWTMFATQTLQDALNLDSLPSSHPVEVAVHNPSEIHQIFDSISYLKGASVIRMATSWLTTKTFLSGIHLYLNKHKYHNAATSDLWAALSLHSGKNVSEFMNTWVQQTGYPLLNVTLVGDDKVEITQSRYLLTGEVDSEEDKTTWWVPLGLKHESGVEDYVLVNKTQTFNLPAGSFKLNHLQTGLYRVNYSKDIINNLISELGKPEYGILSDPIDRAGLISDLSVLSQSGEQSVITFLNFIQNLKSEKNYFVLSEIARQLGVVITLYENNPDVNTKLQALRRSLFAPLADDFGWKSFKHEPELYNLLRVLVISEAGLAGQSNVVQTAQQKYKDLMKKNIVTAISPDMTGTVYRIVLNNAVTPEEENQIWDDIFNKVYSNEEFPMDQRIIALTSIGYNIKSSKVIQKNLDLILDEDQIRTQDAWMVFKSLGTNYHSRTQLIEYFIKNYDKIYKRFENSMGGLGNAVSYMISGLSNSTQIEQLENFFASKDTSEYFRSLNGALEKAKVNAAQLEREKDQMILWAKN